MVYDVIVVGGGAAGMTAALYALRNGKTVMILEREGFGGQITHSPKVENFPGTLSMSGNEFADKLFDQIIAQGAEFEIEDVVSVEDGEIKSVHTEDGNTYYVRSYAVSAAGTTYSPDVQIELKGRQPGNNDNPSPDA